jgi:AcrR family transcriptional regulator
LVDGVDVGSGQVRRGGKRERTRQHLLAVAQRLFREQGFERTTVAEIARAADVVVQTVFNHVSSKEELFFGGWAAPYQAFSGAPERMVGEAEGEAVVRVLTGAAVDYVVTFEDPELQDMVAQVLTVPALGRYERDMSGRGERELAAHLEATGLSMHPRWTAALLLATTRALIQEHRRRVLAGAVTADSLARFSAELRRHLQLMLYLAPGDVPTHGGREVTPCPACASQECPDRADPTGPV